MFIQVIFYVALLSGCCPTADHVEPSYPSNLTGWDGTHKGGTGGGRTFVLRKGETTDNGLVQVKIVDIFPPKPCAEAGSFERQPRARIQFVRSSDQKILCEDIYAEGGGAFISPERYGSNSSDLIQSLNMDIKSITIIAINLKEEWVFFRI